MYIHILYKYDGSIYTDEIEMAINEGPGILLLPQSPFIPHASYKNFYYNK